MRRSRAAENSPSSRKQECRLLRLDARCARCSRTAHLHRLRKRSYSGAAASTASPWQCWQRRNHFCPASRKERRATHPERRPRREHRSTKPRTEYRHRLDATANPSSTHRNNDQDQCGNRYQDDQEVALAQRARLEVVLCLGRSGGKLHEIVIAKTGSRRLHLLGIHVRILEGFLSLHRREELVQRIEILLSYLRRVDGRLVKVRGTNDVLRSLSKRVWRSRK